MKLSVVIPCYNEQDSLGELLRRVRGACVAAAVESYEIVLVNDGSRDATWSLIAREAQTSHDVVGVELARNHGHQLALTAGLTVARGERVFVLDADLQDPPELLGAMMAVMDEGADVVYGVRSERRGETAFKRLTAAAFYRTLNRLTDVDIPLDTGDFRLMSRRIVDTLNAMPESNRFIRGMVSWVGHRQVAFPYRRDDRFAGETKYPLSKMIKLAIDAITGFSTTPLRMASYFGLIFGTAGILCLVYVLGSWIWSSTIRGWTSLITIVLLLGSAQLIVLGFIGEYLGRLYIESKRRPNFLIQTVIGQADPKPALASNHGAAR